MKLAYLAVSAAAIALALPGCRMSNAPANGNNPAAAAQRRLAGLRQQFHRGQLQANPGFAVSQGRHEYDGQIADLSPAGISSEVDRLKKAIADAQGFTDDKLTPEQRYRARLSDRGRQGPAVLDRSRPAPTSCTTIPHPTSARSTRRFT